MNGGQTEEVSALAIPATVRTLAPYHATQTVGCVMYTNFCITPERQLSGSFRVGGGGGVVSSREAAHRCRWLLSLKFTSRGRRLTGLYWLLNCGRGNGYNITQSLRTGDRDYRVGRGTLHNSRGIVR